MEIGKIEHDLLQVLDLGTTPLINALVIISHHTNIILWALEQLQQLILHAIGILELVHKDISKAVLQLATDLRVIAQQLYHLVDEITKIDRTSTLTEVLIAGKQDLM